MITIFLSIAVVFTTSAAAARDDCDEQRAGMGMPLRVKVSGKPRAVKWGRVNKILGEYLIESARLKGCDASFQEVFSPARQDAYFPVLFNLLRLVPEESLMGVAVFSQDGTLMGHFENIVVFEKRGARNYSNYYFQFRDQNDEFQSAGKPELIDIRSGKPLFLLKWEDIQGRPLLSSRVGAR